MTFTAVTVVIFGHFNAWFFLLTCFKRPVKYLYIKVELSGALVLNIVTGAIIE